MICLVFAIGLAWFIFSGIDRQTLGKSSRNAEASKTKPFSAATEGDNAAHSSNLHVPSKNSEATRKLGQQQKRNQVEEEDPYSKSKAFSMLVRTKNNNPDPLTALDIDLEPRKPHQPVPLHLPPGDKIRLTVKFMDRVMARFDGDNQIQVSDVKPKEINQLVTLARKHRLVFNPVFDNPEDLDALRLKAARRSGQMQADLNGTMAVDLADPLQALEIAQSIQSIAMIETVDIESLDSPTPPPADIPPTTPSLVDQQGYLGSNPGFGVNQLKALGVNGEGVRLSDCEYGYNWNHEDLVDSSITDESRAQISPSVYERGWDNHGTAALGVTMAGDNGYGVTGIAPKCDAHFYSEWTTLGYNRTTAVSDAVTGSTAGDIILLEMQRDSGAESKAYVPAEYSSTIWNLTKTATDAGIIVVAAAGNGNQDLDSAYYESYMNRGDSGAIIVGAGSSSITHGRRSFSTYGSRVDVQAWGDSVMTTGYGGYAKYGDDDNQSYSRFSGTSSASACAAGALVLLQSYAKNKLGTLFTPAEMRAHLKSYGHPQGGLAGNVGPAIALDLAVDALPDRPAQLTISPPNGDDLPLSFWGLPFRSYKIETSQDLIHWNDLIIGVSGSKNKIDEVLKDELGSYSKRFYRLSEE